MVSPQNDVWETSAEIPYWWNDRPPGSGPLKRVRNCQNNLSTTDSFLKRLMKRSRMVMKFDLYSALMINQGNRILNLFHLYCCSGHKLSTILIANVANLFRFVTLTDFDSKHNSSHFVHFICTYYFGYWIITNMGYSKYTLSTINMLYSLKKKLSYHTSTSQ